MIMTTTIVAHCLFANAAFASADDADIDVAGLLARLIRRYAGRDSSLSRSASLLGLGLDDVCQELMLKCWTAYGGPSSRPPGRIIHALKPLLISMIRHMSIDLAVRARRRPILVMPDDLPEMIHADADPEHILAAREALQAAAGIVADMPLHRRHALLSAIQGAGSRNDAERQNLTRARRDLRRALAGAQDDSPRARQSSRISDRLAAR
ncbi:RNA polymerase sigma factor [Falsiroseomonas sp. HW251]|uniref:RNA polymerase sigma factor n=1 Tax=Falsiroseomonas sp. HW251 TaxID=3390998 RepID=UPI003D317BDA